MVPSGMPYPAVATLLPDTIVGGWWSYLDKLTPRCPSVASGVPAALRVAPVRVDGVLMIDPYADEKLVSEYALLAPDSVAVRILTDAADYKPTLKPAADRWIKQWPARPLAVRLAPDRTLHDRMIVIDGVVVWSLGQSFNRLAERAHTSLTKMDSETAERKISVYSAAWDSATPL